MSVGEWLNGVIRAGGDDYGESMRFADDDEADDDDWRDEPRQDHYRRRPRSGYREPRRRHAIEHEAASVRDEIGEVNARLDRLTHQLERMAGTAATRLTGAPREPSRGRAPPPSRNGNHATPGAPTSVDDAVAEIAERQRVLYGETAPAAPPDLPDLPDTPAPPAYAPGSQDRSNARADISHIEDQLRYLTTRIELLRPNGDLERVIRTVRQDLSDIRHQLTQAQPRNAVASLENEVDALAERIDHSRQSGADSNALGALEHGVAEIRDALRHLRPAESLIGFDEAVKDLAQKVDRIIAKEDPAALQQLEAAIDALHGVVAHVASNDTLNKVADDVRGLAAKIDALASTAASGEAVSALEGRIETLASALSASAEAGQAVPRDLEKLLSGLIEKLEWVQLTHTDHAALGQLEDRIAQLMKRLDASDARLGNLEAVERGLADLLVHIDQIRGTGGAAKPVAVDAIVRDVAEIRRSEQRTQDSLEAVHGAVEQVVDRLAMLESGIHDNAVAPEGSAETAAPAETAEPVPASAAAPPEPEPPPLQTWPEPPAVQTPPEPANAESPARRIATPRAPIDPNLPPDHPLEPGTAGSPRLMPSAADRIAASEAAVGMAKPPVIAEPSDKPNFIAAARRAAQAAAAAPPERPVRPESTPNRAAETGRPSRLRKLLVAAAAIMIVVGGLHIVMHMFQDRSTPNDGAVSAPPAPAEQTPPPTVVPETPPQQRPQAGPLVLPVPGAAAGAPPNAAPNAAPATTPPASLPATPANPARQSALPDAGEITGALAQHAPQPLATEPPVPIAPAQAPQSSAPATIVEKLPATIGGPILRAAAMAGDAAAEFEVATRFAEGHGVPPSNEAAVRWLDRAAKQGSAPAQFRLGGLYEKGVGVKKDLAMARELYAAAAAKGNGKAMHNLAVLYAEGINGPGDYRTAAHWFRDAAERGITDSQYNLAILYARGVGVEQNYAESYKWFALAAIAGDAEAGKKRDEVATHLDEQSLAAAKAAVQKWSAEPQPDDAVSVKAPPGGWDMPDHAAKPKPRSAANKPAASDPKLN